ncbi:MAG: NAD(P)/FAD-dependent oxidoreductase [Lachnospiraceae bacterium]|nr:NAD(P)/FAD-dependent oxidoreductase [Lachnospiraceae bacterium]
MQSPIGEMMANPDGTPSEQMIAYYTERAKGGVGIVCPAVFCVDYPTGKTVKFQVRVDNDYCIRDLTRMAEQIQRYGALFIPQIHHAGAQTSVLSTEGQTPVCVSDKDVAHVFIQGNRMVGPQHEMTTDEVKTLVQKFINAALICQKSGCDGVSLHAAHGYLINQFLSPELNARTDEYGGSLENRCRFAVEAIEGIRAACGSNFVIGARLPGKEWTPNGLTDEECVEIAQIFEKAGCDFFDVSAGSTDVASRLMETDWYEQGNRVQYGEAIKKAVSVPVGAVGVLRDPDFCEKLIADGKLDFVVLGRTLVCDPYWPEKAKTGRVEEIRPCLTCSDGCLNQLTFDHFVSCALNPATGRELKLANIQKANQAKNVVVIGGGIGGMQAAITAAQRGHNVTLLEKEDHLGGQMCLAALPPHKEAVGKARDWFAGEVIRQGVNVRLNCPATVESVTALTPDTVILATGATPITKVPVEGCEHTVPVWDVMQEKCGKLPENSRVAIIGGGLVGCEFAEMLMTRGNTVSIIEMLPTVANGLEGLHLGDLLTDFAMHGVQIYTNSPAKKITPKSVTFLKEGREEVTIDVDMTVLATGQVSAGKDLAEELEAAGCKVLVIGDAKQPRRFLQATLEATYAGMDA